jgi:NADH:ubiquinone oxidoreductase subunit E
MEINICLGSSCFARGNQKNLEIIKNLIAENNLTDKVKLSGTLCEGSCGSGPCMTIDSQKFENVNPPQIKDILTRLFNKMDD